MEPKDIAKIITEDPDIINERVKGDQFGKVNAPTFAYITVYGEEPQEFISGRTDSPKKEWNGIMVDANLKDEWLDQLNNLPVEIRSSDEGKNNARPAFIIFRMPPEEDDMAFEIADYLNQYEELYAKADMGNTGRPRICVAGKTWIGEDGWEEWWNSLADKIKESYYKI